MHATDGEIIFMWNTALFRNFVKNIQNFSIRITDCRYEIYLIKSHVLFMQAAKILYSHDWPDNLHRKQITPIDESGPLF